MEKKKNTTQKASENKSEVQAEQIASAEIVAKSSTRRRESTVTRKPIRWGGEGTVKSKKRSAFPVGTVFILIVTTLLLMMMVSNYVIINEYTQEAAALRSQLQELSTEKDKLTIELEKKNDYMTMQEYASDKLGMIGEENVDKAYIEVDDDDSIEVYEIEEDGTKGMIATVMAALSENFMKAWNTLTDGE